MTLVECATLMSITPSRRLLSGVELRGFEPLTFSLRTRRATDCAIAPRTGRADQHADFTTGSSRSRRLRKGPPATSLPLLRLRSLCRGNGVGVKAVKWWDKAGSGDKGATLPPGYADAAFRASSPSSSATASPTGSGASAVTGTCGRVDAVTPGPDRSMVRTVRGASGLDT